MIFLKTLVFSLLAVNGWATSGLQEPTAIVGSYEYKGVYEYRSHEHFEFVYAKTDEQRRKLEELRAGGYTCTAKQDDNWICRKIVEPSPQDTVVARKVSQRFDGMQVRFSEIVGLDQIVDGDVYKVWNARQKATITSKAQPEARFFDTVQYAWTPTETKVYPGGNETNPAHDMFTPGDGSVGVLWDFAYQTNHFQMDTYTVFAILPKTE